MQSRRTIPLYQQIAIALSAQINSREWAPGEQIPSEAELANSYSVSIMTLRQAIAILVDKRLLVRQQGRGTFVAQQSHNLAAEARIEAPFSQVSAEMAGLEVRALDLTLVKGPGWVFDELNLDRGKSVFRARRVRHAHGRPVAFTTSYFPERLGVGLKPNDLVQPSLVQVIERRQRIALTSATQTVEATIADPECATELNVTFGSPLLLVHRIYMTDKLQPMYISVARYGSDMFRYHMTLRRDPEQSLGWTIAGTVSDVSAGH